MPKRVAVIGLGRFGSAMAIALAQQGHEVIAIDADETRVQNLLKQAELDRIAGIYPVTGNATEEAVLDELDVPRLDAVVVAIGSDLVASILTTVLIRQKVEENRRRGGPVPRLVARARDRTHANALTRLGVDRVIRPEEEMGEEWAKKLFTPLVQEYIPLSGGLALALAQVPPHLDGKTIREAGLFTLRTRRQGLAVMAILPRRGDPVLMPSEEERLRGEDRVLVVGREQAIRRALEGPTEGVGEAPAAREAAE